MEPCLVFDLGPPSFPEVRPSFDSFQAACRELGYAEEQHPWPRLERDLLATLFRREANADSPMDETFSDALGTQLRVERYHVTFGRSRGAWVAQVWIPLSALRGKDGGPFAGRVDASARNAVAGFLGLALARDWIGASAFTPDQ